VKQTETAEIAQTLYEVVIGSVGDQLRLAADSLSGVDESDAKTLQKKLDAALPADALPHVRNFVLTLAQERQLAHLPGVVEAFERYRSGPQGTYAEVVSAMELDSAQQELITSNLRQLYDPQLDPHFKVDESLIGGLIIRVGDKVLDNSLRTRLSVVQRSMLSS
jgi:F-type H+-transporting ATPase subunit delta